VLFVTVACGAISGFHSMVSSGTTAKQLNKETDALAVGYGSMMIEGLLAVIALTAAASLAVPRFESLYAEHKFVPMFSDGVGMFLSGIPLLKIPAGGASSFAALAVSAFALTSLDTCTRLARFVFQEFFERKGATRQSPLATNRFLSTAVCVAAGFVLLKSGRAGAIWPVFGSANQLLAAIALLAVTVWLVRLGRKSMFVTIPMCFMFAVTLAALGTLIFRHLASGNVLLLGVSILLFAVAVALAVLARSSLRRISTNTRAIE
jgi:carbon starvation protein